jgi:hypothetical protein
MRPLFSRAPAATPSAEPTRPGSAEARVRSRLGGPGDRLGRRHAEEVLPKPRPGTAVRADERPRLRPKRNFPQSLHPAVRHASPGLPHDRCVREHRRGAGRHDPARAAVVLAGSVGSHGVCAARIDLISISLGTAGLGGRLAGVGDDASGRHRARSRLRPPDGRPACGTGHPDVHVQACRGEGRGTGVRFAGSQLTYPSRTSSSEPAILAARSWRSSAPTSRARTRRQYLTADWRAVSGCERRAPSSPGGIPSRPRDG